MQLLLVFVFLFSINTYATSEKCSRLVSQLLSSFRGASRYSPLNDEIILAKDIRDEGILIGDWVVISSYNKRNIDPERLFVNREKLIGRIQKDKKGRPYLALMNFGKPVKMFIPENSISASVGDFVSVKVQKTEFNDGTPVRIKIEEVIGKDFLTNEQFHLHHVQQNAIAMAHTAPAVEEAQKLIKIAKNYNLVVENELKKGRTDLRHLPLRSIDNITTVDYDDMIYVEKNETGYSLFVAVSDVAHWVEKDSILGKEGSKRNLTSYFENVRYPLYPEEFERYLSLIPHEDRLALVVKIDLDEEAKRLGYEIFEAVVHNRKAWNYEEIAPLWDDYLTRKETPFDLDFELYQKIHKRRKSIGASYFGRKAYEFLVKPGDLTRYSKQEEGHELIAEFMIEANEVVGEFMKDHSLPAIYRAHSILDRKGLEQIQKLANSIGIKNIHSSSTLSEILQKSENPVQHEILIANTLRNISTAYYTPLLDGHSTLASKTYMQFTSPIRRDTDTINHRILKAYLNNEPIPYDENELRNKAEYATAKIVVEKRRERVLFQDNKMLRIMESGKKNFKATPYYIGRDFINLRIEEFDFDVTIEAADLRRKGFRFVEEEFMYKNKRKKINLGLDVKLRLDKWDRFSHEAKFSVLF